MDALEPLVQIQKDLTPPGGRDYWTDPQEGGKPPIFTTREVALTFFAKTKLWLILLEGRYDVHVPRTPAGYRQFQLHHVELISHAFLSQGLIDLRTFRNSIIIIKSIADNYRLN